MFESINMSNFIIGYFYKIPKVAYTTNISIQLFYGIVAPLIW